jgi:DNA-binding transcriptional LysR family regulator
VLNVPKSAAPKSHQLPLAALRAFEAAGRQLSVRKAADALFLTPSAVSQHIRGLEAKLGVELFVRRNRRLAFTDDGRHLFHALRESFGQMERAIAEIDRSPATRKLRLKLLPTFAIRWFMPRVGAFLCEHPELEVEITTTARADDASLDDVDFAPRYGGGDWRDVDAVRIFDEEWALVCAPSVARSLKQPADVFKHTQLHSMMRPDAWSVWLSGVGVDAADSGRGQRFSNGALALQAAVDSLGIAVVQRAYLEPDISSGRLVMPFKRTVKRPFGYYLVSSRGKAGQPKIRQFLEWLLSRAGSPAGPLL